MLVFATLLQFTFLGLVAGGVLRSALSDGAGYAIFAIGFTLLIISAVYSNRQRYINLEKVRLRNTNMIGAPESDIKMQTNDYENDLKGNPYNNGSTKKL